MPFYELKELEKRKSRTNDKVEAGAVPGEFMKFGVVTKPEGEGPPLHEHPNEEQFSLVISGQLHFVLGDEDRVVGPGTLIHIPRNTRHRSRPRQRPCDVHHHQEPARDRRARRGLPPAPGSEGDREALSGQEVTKL